MARRSSRRSPEDVARRISKVSAEVQEATQENTEPRPTRSKRGIVLSETSQICFRIEKERHKELRVYCVEQDMEIGEVLDELIRKHLGI